MFCVLLAEDEPNTRRLLGSLVQSLRPESRVYLAKNGTEALQMVEKTRIDLVLTDIRMPEVDGIELAKRLYERRFTGKVAIISAYDMFEYAQQAIKYQVFAYLLKPVDADALAEVLDRASEASLAGGGDKPGSEAIIPETDRFQICLGYLGEHYAEELTLDSVAGYLYLHPSYFSNWFKKKSGKTFIHYLNELRIERAKELLRDGGCSVQQAASLVGFSDTGYFIKQFKQFTRQTPTQFRLLLIQNDGEPK